MIPIYSPVGLDGYELCQPKNHDDYENITKLLNGNNKSETWHPLDVKIVSEDQGKRLKKI